MKRIFYAAFMIAATSNLGMADVIQQIEWPTDDVIKNYPQIYCSTDYIIICDKQRPECKPPIEFSALDIQVDFIAKTIDSLPLLSKKGFQIVESTKGNNGYNGYVVISLGNAFLDVSFLEPGVKNTPMRFSFTHEEDKTTRQIFTGRCTPDA